MGALDDYRVEAWTDSDGLWKSIADVFYSFKVNTTEVLAGVVVAAAAFSGSNLTTSGDPSFSAEHVFASARASGDSDIPVVAKLRLVGNDIERRLGNLTRDDDVDVDADLLARIEAAMAREQA